MNKILWNLINTKEVTSFIDNVIVETEEKERYDEIMKEVVKLLAKNNLYIKLKKCKQRMREVEFLKVVIGPEEIKIKEVLDQLIPKRVKNIQKFLGLANYY